MGADARLCYRSPGSTSERQEVGNSRGSLGHFETLRPPMMLDPSMN
ncbi:hypothetical protein LBMAG21_17200 [Armatimonadota bacterium]|nr:hypothetical protein LBMAG21_17200 [Armatimonadota bacterium]